MCHGVTGKGNGTLYDESETQLIGLGGSTGVPTFHSPGNIAAKARAFSVPAFEGAGSVKFQMFVDADDTTTAVDMGDGGDMKLSLYDNNCFEEEDKQGGPFECGAEDKDGSRQGLLLVTSTINVDVD